MIKKPFIWENEIEVEKPQMNGLTQIRPMKPLENISVYQSISVVFKIDPQGFGLRM